MKIKSLTIAIVISIIILNFIMTSIFIVSINPLFDPRAWQNMLEGYIMYPISVIIVGIIIYKITAIAEDKGYL